MVDTVDNRDRLYELLPALYRERDAEEGYPLRSLLRLMADQHAVVKSDIDGLWNNFFIETCDRWVIPYVGDLVSNNALHAADRRELPDVARERFPDLIGPDLRPPSAIRTRADVAKTIYYRRRKGTLPMLEELARDVSGWPAHAVEFFELLDWAQNLNHRRFHSHECPDLRRVEFASRVDGPFDAMAHTVDVRPIGQFEGWHNIRNIGFFLWTLRSYGLKGVRARQAELPWQYTFSPLGNRAPLFSQWRREGDEARLATELHVPTAIRPSFFYEDLKRYKRLLATRPEYTDLYGMLDQGRSFGVYRGHERVHPAGDPEAAPTDFAPQIVCRCLDPWPTEPPAETLVAIDVESGRLAVGGAWSESTESLYVDYHYGFSADVGGGPYPRGHWLVDDEHAEQILRVSEESSGTSDVYASVEDALAQWSAHPERNTVIRILDSRSYTLPASIALSHDGWLVVEADNGQRPLLQATDSRLEITTSEPGDTIERAALTLSGVVIEGYLEVTGDLGRLRLLHTTLIPGRSVADAVGVPQYLEPSLIVHGTADTATINTQLRTEIAFSIVGALRIPSHAEALWVVDSVIDCAPPEGDLGQAENAIGTSAEPVPPATLERVTVFGTAFFRQLRLASEVIFTGPVQCLERQEGCVRFSYVPPDSRTPRRYRCQADFEIAERIRQAEEGGLELGPAGRAAIRAQVRGWLRPSFTDTRYGQPAYAQLRFNAPVQIRRGAADESEMGVFCHLKQPQRETNLRIRLDEYLPFGLQPGLVYLTYSRNEKGAEA